MKKKTNPIDHEAELTYSKAAKAELSRDYDLAFRLYVKSAELYLHLSRSNSNLETQSTKWKANAGKSLQRAEKIKAYVDKQKSPDSRRDASTHLSTAEPNVDLTPVGINHFSTQEQSYVLRKGGDVNGLFFPLWDDSMPQSATLSASGVYQDPNGQPKLSPEQAKVNPLWIRGSFQESESSPEGGSDHCRILPQDVVQHIVTDCSVCASISVCLEHSRRFGSNLAKSAVHAIRRNSPPGGNYTADFSGRYDIKVLFNGTWRRITIDDRLPYNPVDSSLMCMSVICSRDDSRTRRPTLWPSILEKGYMRLLGGYDFLGSNSSIDLHAITGWIPEHIEIKGPNFEREKSWVRLLQGFSRGHCMVTLGTGTSSYTAWGDVQLLPFHSYAVVDVVESKENRVLTILDTWVNPNSSSHATGPSTLKMPWTDALNVFDGIYLSWDPSLWAKNLNFHGMWKRGDQDDRSSTLQVFLEFEEQGHSEEQEVWALLTRHVTDSSRTSDFVSLKVEVEDELRNQFNNQTTIAARGTYTNSTHVLARTRIPASQTSGMLSILTSYDGDAKEVGFTLTIYAGSSLAISWNATTPTPLFTKKVEGNLTNKNSGGNFTYPTFMLNPQYHLQIHSNHVFNHKSDNSMKAKVVLTLKTGRNIPVNILLAYSGGARVDELVDSELAASSGAYSYGLARVEKEIVPGNYTVVISAFEPQHVGPFTLEVDCSCPFGLKSIPQEDAGMYTKVISGAWEEHTAVGGPTSDRYSKNPTFEIDVPSTTQLKIRLQLVRPFTPSSLNVTIFPATADGSLRRHLATSGAYKDAISGVVTPQISLGVGRYWVIPSTYNPGVEARFQLFVYSTVSGLKIGQKTGS